MKPPYRLATDDLSNDTLKATAQMHRQAKAGHAIGTAAIVMYEGGFFVTTITGECHRSPVWSIGAIDILQAKLRQLAQAESET